MHMLLVYNHMNSQFREHGENDMDHMTRLIAFAKQCSHDYSILYSASNS